MNGIKGWKPSPIEQLLAEPLRPDDQEPVAIIDEDLMVVQPLDGAIKELINEKE